MQDIRTVFLTTALEEKREKLSLLIGEERPIIVFGSGNLGKQAARFLLEQGLPVTGFADNNKSKWGTTLLDKRVDAPDAFSSELKTEAIWLVAIWSPGNLYQDILQQLRTLGVRHVFHATVLMQLYPEQWLPYYHFHVPDYFKRHREEIVAVYEQLADEESKRQFQAQLLYRLSLDFDKLPIPDRPHQYFPEGIVKLSDREVFLDAGAFNGDTLKAFAQQTGMQFEKYLGLEPDPANFELLRQAATDYPEGKLALFPYAVGEEEGIVHFNAIGGPGAAIAQDGTFAVSCKRIDDTFFDYKPTFLKFDIEGAELSALIGAEKTIATYRPKIAVCIYHKPDDLWCILSWLLQRFSFYRFYVRTHEFDGFEFVLYAIPT